MKMPPMSEKPFGRLLLRGIVTLPVSIAIAAVPLIGAASALDKTRPKSAHRDAPITKDVNHRWIGPIVMA